MTAPFHHRLDDLRQLLLSMGGLVENQLFRATRALFEGDEARAQHAIALDAEVDSLEVRVDQKCVRLLALERIGDHATNIAEMTLYVADGRLERHATRH